MNLTPEQLKVIRESVIDERAYQRVISVFKEESHSPPQNSPSSEAYLFDLDRGRVELLSTFLNAVPVAIYVKDLDSRFVIANQYTLDMVNVTSQREIIGKTDFDLLQPDVAQFHFDLEQKLLRTGESSLDLELTWEDECVGHTWVLVTKTPISDRNGKIVGLIGVNRDITRQKLAERSLENQRNLLQTLIDHIQDKVYIKDRNSQFLTANAITLSEQRITTLEELVGTTDFEYMDAERARRMMDEEQRIMATGEPIINQELFTPADVTRKHPMWFLISKVPVYDEKGEISGLVGINRDITSLKLAEQRRVELELERERGTILSDFITHSSHEFRTPFSIILTSTYLLEKTNDGEKRQARLAQIRQQVYRLTHLIDSLQLMLRLDRATSLPVSQLDLDSFLKRSVDRIRPRIEARDLTLCLSIDNSEDPAFGNEKMLAIAVSAILDNAVNYMQAGGKLSIRSHSQDNRHIIAVQDTGIGMTDEIMSRIFTRFYRADEARSSAGFGLGLSIAKRIVELHGGYIEVESHVNMGSTFRIILPETAVRGE